MPFFSLAAYIALQIPVYPPVINNPFPSSWRDDYSCYVSFIRENSHETLFTMQKTTKLIPETLFLSSTLMGISYFDADDTFAFASALGWKSKFIQIHDDSLSMNAIPMSTEALWLEDDTRVVIAIPGTNLSQGLNDIAIDTNLFQTPMITGGKVHAGFLKAAQSLIPQISRFADTMTHKKDVVIIGHSLGSAIGTILARLMEDKPNIRQKLPLKAIHLWGSPRVGNRDFVNEFNATFSNSVSVVRIVNNSDFVARIPEFGFEHIGGLVYIDKQGRFYEGDEAKKYMIPSIFRLPLGENWLDDHLPESYTHLVGKFFSGRTLCRH